MNRALGNIKHSCYDTYRLNGISSDYYSTEIFKRLQTVVHFVKGVIELIGRQPNLPTTKLRVLGNRRHQDFYDHIADLMFEIILSAASVKAPADKCWDIHYVAVWGEFFDLRGRRKAWEIILFKLRPLLYDEILRLEKFPNYKSSSILGFCLTVMGLKIRKKKGFGSDYYSFHKAVFTVPFSADSFL